jgi:MFS family permease
VKELTARGIILTSSPLAAAALPNVARFQEAVPDLLPSRASLRGLDWFTFFLADIQTGFGPFVAVYLTARAWTQGDIGLVLTISSLVALVGQIPAGALVDATRFTRLIAMIAVVAISASAVALAGWPIFVVVLGSRVLHAAASCILGPTIAALSLGLVGHAGLGERLGRNARFASIGAGVAAIAMGATGHFHSNQAVFIFTGMLAIPAIAALSQIRPGELQSRSRVTENHEGSAGFIGALLRSRTLLIFAVCIIAFHLSNAAMLPLMSSTFAYSTASLATTWVAACMIVPQLLVAAASPFIGRKAEAWGRRPWLLVCFGALVLRGVIFALTSDPYLVVGAQVLDGVSAAALAVLFPLVIADITRNTGRFNLALGLVGSAMGIGAALSTTLAGYAFDHAGSTATFLGLAMIAATGLVLVAVMMPETRSTRTNA